MSFPEHPYPDAGQYLAAYREELVRAWHGLDPGAVAWAAAMVDEAVRAGRMIYACGNGGSAAIVNHMLCDFLKGIQTGTAPGSSAFRRTSN